MFTIKHIGSTIHFHLSNTTGQPYFRQIQAQITEGIRAGTLNQGDLLPSIRELAAQLLVSAVTVRRAYDALEHDGLIRRQRGRGTFVDVDIHTLERVSLRDAREGLLAAVQRARRLGMDDEQIAATVQHGLEQT